MKSRFGIVAIACMALFLTVFASCESMDGDKSVSSATNDDVWKKKQGNCENVLRNKNSPLAQVIDCTKTWETYRDVSNIPLTERSMYAVAFSRVSYQASDEYERAIADAALARICIPRHPVNESTGEVMERVPSELECNSNVSDLGIAGQGMASGNRYDKLRRSVTILAVSANDASSSEKLRKDADKAKKKGQYDSAIGLYKKALALNPYNINAKYNLAATYSLNMDENESLRELEDLYSWDDDDAEERIDSAANNDDFYNVRDNPNFKLMTGYMRIIITNGAKDFGTKKVQEWKEKLAKNNITVSAMGKSNNAVIAPQIFYREGFDAYAMRIRNILGLPKNTPMMVQKDKNNDADIILVWGQPEAATVASGQTSPLVQGKRTEGGNKLDELTKGVEDAKGSVSNAKDTGSNITKLD